MRATKIAVMPYVQSRGPASVGPEAEAIPLKDAFKDAGSLTLELKCKKINTYSIASSKIRFRNTNCFQQKMKSVSLKNKSNGYTADVFFMKENSFTTDFIDLREGKNEFELSGVDLKGRKIVQSFVVEHKVEQVSSSHDSTN